MSEKTEAGERARQIQTLSLLALTRTEYSSERSLMSWIRTSVSLYTFGFTISKLLDYLAVQDTGIELPAGLHRLGFALICMGIVALVLASFEHLKRIRTMRRLGLPTPTRFSLPLGTTVAMVSIGIATLINLAGVWSP
jgi:putative membrane protein